MQQCRRAVPRLMYRSVQICKRSNRAHKSAAMQEVSYLFLSRAVHTPSLPSSMHLRRYSFVPKKIRFRSLRIHYVPTRYAFNLTSLNTLPLSISLPGSNFSRWLSNSTLNSLKNVLSIPSNFMSYGSLMYSKIGKKSDRRPFPKAAVTSLLTLMNSNRSGSLVSYL